MRSSTRSPRQARLAAACLRLPRPLPAAPLLTITALACSPGRPAPLPLPDDHLIIAIADEYGHLNPIARFADGLWDRPPWATSFGLERFAAVPSGDSADWRWPDGRRMWAVPGRESDTLGYPPGPVAVNVPDEWHFYSDSFPQVSLGTLGLELSSGLMCEYSWSVRTQDGWSRRLPRVGDSWAAGVALSRRPSAVLAADARPDLERILEEAGRGRGAGPEVRSTLHLARHLPVRRHDHRCAASPRVRPWPHARGDRTARRQPPGGRRDRARTMLSRLRAPLLAAAICTCSPAPDSPASQPDAAPAPTAPPEAAGRPTPAPHPRPTPAHCGSP